MENKTEERERLKLFSIKMDEEDRTLLDRLSAEQKLSRSDILRIALRRYAKDLGSETKPAA